jgi:hypothetical protein
MPPASWIDGQLRHRACVVPLVWPLWSWRGGVRWSQSGYFTIPGLKVGGQYELIARAKDGGDLMSRLVVKKPPDPSVLLEIDKKYTSPKTPPK